MVKSRGMHAAIRQLGTLFSEGAVGMLPDGPLLDRFVERRDASAFDAIVERYGPLVWGVCRRVLRDHHDAEDAFQATFLILARKANSIMPREKLSNWLHGVAFQTAMNARANRAKRRVRERPAWEMTEPETVADEHTEELLSRLDREVARLPEKYRMPIILCALEGKTHRQAAEQLGWPVGTVSGRLSRAKAALASRLSRPGTSLTVEALGVLLVHEVARAGMPPGLIRSTAQAAALSTVGKAVAAGVVSAEAAALTGEVLKTMLLSKLMLTTALLVAAVALTAGGTSLAFRARAAESADQTKATGKLAEQSSAAEVVQEEAPPPKEPPKPAEPPKGDQPKRFEATKQDQLKSIETQTPKQGETKPAAASKEGVEGSKDQAARAEAEPAPLVEEQWQRTSQRMLNCGAYSFTATRTGNVAVAYNSSTREMKAVRLGGTSDKPLWVTPVAVDAKDPQLVALAVRGDRITRVAVFNVRLGKWAPLKLDQPVDGAVWPMSIGPQTAAYEVGDFLYLYNPTIDAWDRVDVRTLDDDTKDSRAAKGR
jgi:RNA polymerase sigma factor (sigma-70 family)